MPRSHRSLLELWHLLSLDAPTVAALWCWTLARAAGVRLPWSAPLLLALGTWLLYVIDRVLDGLLATDRSALRERHRFHMRHRRPFLIGAAFVAALLLWLVPTHMLPAAISEYIVLGFCALLYLAVVHVRVPGLARWRSRSAPGLPRSAQWLPKELAVGIIFAVATSVPAWARLAPLTPGRAVLALTVALFAALCWINCVSIELWESGTVAESTDLSGQPPRWLSLLWLARHLRTLSLLLALMALATVVSFTVVSRAHIENLRQSQSVLLAIALSACIFALLHSARRRFSPLRLRIAADAALLTPVLFLPVLW